MWFSKLPAKFSDFSVISTWNLFLIYLLHFPHRSWQTLQDRLLFSNYQEKNEKIVTLLASQLLDTWNYPLPHMSFCMILTYKTVSRKEKIMENGWIFVFCFQCRNFSYGITHSSMFLIFYFTKSFMAEI